MTWVLTAVMGLLVVDAALTWWVRSRVATILEDALGTPVEVDVRGWPASLRLPLGRLRAVVLRAREVRTGRIRLDRLEVLLSGVRPRWDTGRAWSIVSSGGTFRARLGPEAFRAVAPLPSSVVSVTLLDDRVRFGFPGGVSVDASVAVEDDVVVLAPQVERLELLSVLRFAFPPEELPFGADVRQVEAVEGALLVRGLVGEVEVSPAGAHRGGGSHS